MRSPGLVAALLAGLLAAIWAGAPGQVTAQETAVPTPEQQPAPTTTSLSRYIELAPESEATELQYQNRPITMLRAYVLGSSPASRASLATARLDRLVDSGGPLIVDAVSLPEGEMIRVDGETVFAIVPFDLDLLAGEALAVRVEAAQAALRQAVAEARELRTPGLLLRALARSAAITLAAGLLLWLLASLRHRFELPLRAVTTGVNAGTLLGRVAGELGERLLRLGRRVIILVLGVMSVAVLFGWLTFVLRQFPYTRPWGEAMRGYLLGTIGWVLGGLAAAAPGVFTVLVIVIIARLMARGVDALFGAVEVGRLSLPGLDADVARPTRKIAAAIIWLFAIVVAYPYLPGSDTEAFKGLSVMVGLVVSIGSTGVVNQAMSGLMVMYSRTLRNGDFVRIGDIEGVVTQLGMLSTKVRTLQRQEVTVPNAVVISQPTTNFTRLAAANGAGIEVRLSIGYDTPWRQVHAILLQAANRTDGVRSQPEPIVLQSALDDFYVQYRLLAWVDAPAQRPLVLSRLHGEIQDLCNEHGVQIMSPHYEGDPATAKVVPTGSWSPPPAEGD